MNLLGTFSGIGGFELAAQRAGMTVKAMIEIDKHAQTVLNRHFPGVPIHSDIKEITHETIKSLGKIDIITGGFPCQDLSVAGKRAGLAGKRSGLFYQLARVIEQAQPRWLVLENVPGLLSSNNGYDFYAVQAELVNLGYSLAWRVLDAQFFGVPQRRRRVFIVGCIGDGSPEKVLFEQESLPRNTQLGGKEREATAAQVSGNVGNSDRNSINQLYERNFECDFSEKSIAPTVHTLVNKSTTSVVVKIDNTQSNGWGVLEDGTTHTLGGSTDAVLSYQPQGRRVNYGGVAATLTANPNGGVKTDPVLSHGVVRRLTPLECERLQGFPDNWTDNCSDTQRYKQTGNAVAVPVVEWILRRLADLD